MKAGMVAQRGMICTGRLDGPLLPGTSVHDLPNCIWDKSIRTSIVNSNMGLPLGLISMCTSDFILAQGAGHPADEFQSQLDRHLGYRKAPGRLAWTN